MTEVCQQVVCFQLGCVVGFLAMGVSELVDIARSLRKLSGRL